MNNRGIFGQTTKEKLDVLQKQEDYKKCCQLYLESDLDRSNTELRKMKELLYRVLATYLVYDPVLEKDLSAADISSNITIFDSLSPKDPQYENKMCATLLVLYYCIKNRSYNYVLAANASHDEISQGEYLREWLENNADCLISGRPKVKILVSALLTLLYDKVLGATVELVHFGENVPDSITTYHVGDTLSYSEINYRNTTKFQKINALKLKCMNEYRDEYIERRNFWKQNVPGRAFQANKNTFLFGTYNLREFNAFLSQFDFKLFDISTKYYENYFSNFINPVSLTITPIKRIIYLLTDNQRKQDELTRKHREWPVSFMIKSLLKNFLIAIPIVVLVVLIFFPLGEDLASILAILAGLVVFTPPFNRRREKKKRAMFSLLK